MKTFAFSLLAMLILTGCPPPCQPAESLRVDEMDPGLIGKWSGISTSPFGEETFCDFRFRPDGTFLLEFHLAPGEVGTFAGEWATMHFERYDARLDLAIGCTNFTDLQDITYRIWNYQIDGDALTAGRPADFASGPDSTDREGAFYELSRVD